MFEQGERDDDGGRGPFSSGSPAATRGAGPGPGPRSSPARASAASAAASSPFAGMFEPDDPAPARVEVHNHFLGVLPARAFIDAVGEGSPQALLERMAAAVRVDPDYAGHYRTDEDGARSFAPLADGAPREGKGAQAHANVRVIEAALREMREAASDAEARMVAEAAVRQALEASEHTPFDGAYSIRDTLIKRFIDPQVDEEGRPAARAYRNYARMAVKELMREGIEYCEQSQSLNKLARKPGMGEAAFPPGIIDEVRGEALAELRAEDPRFRAVDVTTEVRFLAMMETGVLAGAQRDAGKTPEQTFESRKQALEKLLRERPDVAGVDIANPEKFAFKGDQAEVSHAQENLGALYRMVQGVARDVGRPLVLRPHVGEGYRDDTPGREATHHDTARDNTEALLRSVEALAGTPGPDGRPLYTGDPQRDGVQLRFGHATHATPEQAERMARLGIVAEVNLTSNLESGSVHSFEDHSLLHLVAQGATVMLGTDGQGVMKTTLRAEHERARDVLEDFRNGKTSMRLSRAQAAELERASGEKLLCEPMPPPRQDELTIRYRDLPESSARARIDAALGRFARDAAAYRESVAAADAHDLRRARAA